MTRFSDMGWECIDFGILQGDKEDIMKRWLGILSGLICCALCSFSVRADMIWEPQEIGRAHV